LENYNILASKTEDLRKQLLNEAGIFNWLKGNKADGTTDQNSLKDELFKIIDAWADGIRKSMDLFFNKRMKDKFLKKPPIEIPSTAVEEKPTAIERPTDIAPVNIAEPPSNSTDDTSTTSNPPAPEVNTEIKKPKQVKEPRNKVVVTNPDVKPDISNNPVKILGKKTLANKEKVKFTPPIKKIKNPTKEITDNPNPSEINANPDILPLYRGKNSFDGNENECDEYKPKKSFIFNDATLYERTLICLEDLRKLKS
jgi:hypothetical protein